MKMEKTIPFIEPVLALCSDRTRPAKQNPLLAGPDVWLPHVISQTDDLCAISFDYFINWETNILDRELWLKCLIDTQKIPNWADLSDTEVSNILRENHRFIYLVKFARCNQASATAFIFDDSQDWGDDRSILIRAHWPRDISSGYGLEISRLRRPELEEQIRKKSGGPIKIGSKGLIYSTSRLECFLSTTDALWPGDADLLICNKKSMNPIAIIEYKKHTDRSSIKFSDQMLSNYYPKPDGRKYDRLALLSEQLAADYRIKLFTLYYSTLSDVLDVKLEEISGVSGELSAGKVNIFGISPDSPEIGYRDVLNTILGSEMTS